MANASLDHMLALTIFIAALILFIGFFSGTIQTAISYKQQTALSTKTSDLLDTMLLNPGIPSNWAKSDSLPGTLGLQDPEFSQYTLSPLSTMRITPKTQAPVFYSQTGLVYSNLTNGFGSYILTPQTKTIDYATAAKMLGINGTYGFQFTLTPTLTVNIEKTSTGAPLWFDVDVTGNGLVLANANITYNLIVVDDNSNQYPSYRIISGSALTGADGSLTQPLSFPDINGETRVYSLLVYAYIYGLKGMGYYVHVPQSTAPAVVPIVSSFEDRVITLAHSNSVGAPAQHPGYSRLYYNASFAIVTEEYRLRQVFLDENATGSVDYGPGSTQPCASVMLPDNAGILIIAYKGTTQAEQGIVLAPWGLGPISYPVSFGGDACLADWVTTDIRQVTIGGLAYQAQLAMWSLREVPSGYDADN